jgi:Dolichyl-phosphate-mannose-protein mannosyltransferase
LAGLSRLAAVRRRRLHLLFLLGRDLLGPRRAAAGTLLLTGIAFYAWPSAQFNHNIAQMPFWAAVPWALWRAVDRRRVSWWVLAGALAAGGVYAKLSTVLLLLTLVAWLLWDRDARRCLATPGPWIGLAAFSALVVPLAHWLVVHDFAPLEHARERMPQGGLLIFLSSLLAIFLGMLFLMAIVGLIGPRARTISSGPPGEPVARRAIRYLSLVTAGPLVLAVIGAAATGSGLRVPWASSAFNLAGILSVALTSRRFDGEALHRIAAAAAVLLVVVPLGYATVIFAAPLVTGAPSRFNWPQAEISKRFVDLWKRETGQPLHIVGGDAWIAGLVGAAAADVPSILNGHPSASPWITPERLEREGVLLVWDAEHSKLRQLLAPLIAAAPVKDERFAWKPSMTGEEIVIYYAIVPPKRDRR